MIKVLFISRPTLFSTPGGDTVQMQLTKKFLEKEYDISVSILSDQEAIVYSDYDLIHFFNIIRPNNILPHLKSSLPYVVSPIYVDYSEFDQKVRRGFFGKMANFAGKSNTEYLKTIARWLKNGEHPGSNYFIRKGYKKSVEKILENCKVLLPNSQSELERLKNDYLFSCDAIVVPNAVDISLFTEVENEKKGVICVARIEGRKNQLNLIKAIKQTDLELTIIGKASPNHLAYYEACKQEANHQVKFVDHINQDELVNFYKKAKVHAMISWFETTGLSSLEAAACGCNLVISDKGDQKEYFKDDAFYADPDDITSIKEALLEANSAKYSESLMQRISNEYQWSIAADRTMEAYQLALKKSH